MAVGIENGLTGSIGDQTSSTTYGDYNNDFPTPGVDQPSDTFRVNYKVIQEAIENLQGKAITLTGDVSGSITTPAGGIIDSGTTAIEITTSLSSSFLATDGSSSMTGDLVLDSPATITTSSNWDLTLDPNGAGRLYLQNLLWPNSDGTLNQALVTDGSGNLSWSTVLVNVVEDISPTLGGTLDTDGNSILGGPHVDITVNDPDARLRVSGSGPGPADGIISAQDSTINDNPGGILTLRGGGGLLSGDGGNLVLDAGEGGATGDPGYIKIEYRAAGTYATWPSTDGSATEVLTTDGSGNLYWSTGGGGGGGGVSSVGSGDGLTGGPITTTGTLSVDIVNLSENAAPTGNHWIMIENSGGGTIEKTEIQNLPGSYVSGGGDLPRALVQLSGALSLTDSTPTVITWLIQRQDIGDWIGPFPDTVMTVPAGVTRVRVKAGAKLKTHNSSTLGVFRLRILKNGSSSYSGGEADTTIYVDGFGETYSIIASSPVLNVTPGDEFSVEAYQTTGQTCTLQVDSTWFGIEEATPVEKALDDLTDVNVGNPPTTPEDGYVLTWDDGAGEFVLASVAAVAGGLDSQVQYNNSGVLTGDTSFTTNGSGAVGITGSLDVDDISLDSNIIDGTGAALNIITSGTDADINLTPDGSGIVKVNSLIDVQQIRFDDTGSDATKWVLKENASNEFVFTYGTDQFTMGTTGNINITGSITANDGTTNTDLVLDTTGTGLVVAVSGYDMSSGPDYAFATKDYVDSFATLIPLEDLTNTTITTPANKDFLQYNGSQWVNTNPSIDDLGDVDTTSAAPLAGDILVWDNSSDWVPNNTMRLEYQVNEENVIISNTVDSGLEINFKTRSALGLTQLQSTVNDNTQNAQIGIQRNDGLGTISNNNISFFLSTITGSRNISMAVRDPDDSFAAIKNIIIDGDNGDIDFDAMSLSNVIKISSAGTNTNDDLTLETAGTGLVIASSGYDMSSGPDYAFTTKDYVDTRPILSGVSGSRPGSPVTGTQFFDTTLGIPIWYDGADWVDATGSTA